MPEQIKIEKCTSCGSDQIVVAGNKFLCRPCNIVYEVTDTGTKVLDTNPLDKFQRRLANAENAIAAVKKFVEDGDGSVEDPEPEPEPDPNQEDEPEEDGFIIFE